MSIFALDVFLEIADGVFRVSEDGGEIFGKNSRIMDTERGCETLPFIPWTVGGIVLWQTSNVERMK